MLIKDEVRCSVCPQIFCCACCRILHEQKQHVGVPKDIRQYCFLCQGSSAFALKVDVTQELVKHLVDKHLPLSCNKCKKIYSSKEDFNEIKKCMEKMEDIVMKNEVEEKENSTKKGLPEIEKLLANGKINEEMLTPMTKINLKWRRKSAGLQISDHSGGDNSKNNSLSPTKIRRTTSTPMCPAAGLSMKPITLDSLCSSSFQPSSIDHSSDSSAALTPSGIITPSPVAPKQQQAAQRTQRSSMRQRLPISQTPLRQVMSKSINKAIKEHGRLLTAQRKIAFTSMSSSDIENAALDLRTTPVLKRCASDPVYKPIAMNTEERHEEPKLPSITHTAVNTSSSIEESKQVPQNTASNEPFSAFLSCQPDISFVTPQKSAKNPDTADEIWYTPLPLATPKKVESDENMEEEPAAPQKETSEPRFTGMIRKILGIAVPGTGPPASSILHRAASFAGFIRKKTTPVKAQKRRRYQVAPTSPPQSPVAKKYKTIHGRKPIRRLRTEQ